MLWNHSMVTILFIEFFPNSGAVNGLLAQLKYFGTRQRGRYRCVVAGVPGSLLEGFAVRYGYTFRAIPAVRLNELYEHPLRVTAAYCRGMVSLLRLALQYRVSLVHCNHYEWSPYAVPLAAAMRIPSVVHLKDVYLLTPKIARILMKCSRRTVYIAVSDHVRRLFTGKFKLPQERTVMIHDGIDDGLFRPGSGTNTPPTVVMLGRIVPERDIEVFIDTAALAVRKYPILRFVHYGAGPWDHGSEYFLSLRRRISALGLNRNVALREFVADQQQVAEIFRGAFLTLITARQFALPNAAIESMMCGTPVILADIGGNREIIGRADNCGTLVPTNSPPLFAEAIFRYLEHPRLYESASKTGYIRARKFFSAHTQYRKIDSLYRSLLEGSPGGHRV
jgi:glycosyltransferase involved in cell wall biosynthesis